MIRVAAPLREGSDESLKALDWFSTIGMLISTSLIVRRFRDEVSQDDPRIAWMLSDLERLLTSARLKARIERSDHLDLDITLSSVEKMTTLELDVTRIKLRLFAYHMGKDINGTSATFMLMVEGPRHEVEKLVVGVSEATGRVWVPVSSDYQLGTKQMLFKQALGQSEELKE